MNGQAKARFDLHADTALLIDTTPPASKLVELDEGNYAHAFCHPEPRSIVAI